MERTHIGKLSEKIGSEVLLKGWVDIRRDHGKIIFIDLRDATGKVQMVILPSHPEAIAAASEVRNEWVIEVTGKVNQRPEKMIKDCLNGNLEIEVLAISIINKANTPPFEITDTRGINEEVRLKYRYLDLRTERMQQNIRMRAKVNNFFRDYLTAQDFVEIETPTLIKGTPEGAREFLVPSRLEKGKFYVLPQSPQQFKQLSMVAGFERYFQIAHCYRDEDTRGDRQPEFTQLDLEMSFVTQEDILQLVEKMMLEMVKKIYPGKKISEEPFPRLTYQESMTKYGSDKPDLRQDKNNPDELAFAWVVDFPMFEIDKEGNIGAAHHPFCAIKEEDQEKFMKGEDMMNIHANSYDLVLNGYEIASGSVRIHQADLQAKVFEYLKISPEEQQRKFGHMLEAFQYGAPPHAGIAPGIDRLLMILQNENSIREVIAFAKTGEGRDLLMGAPDIIPEKQLNEYNIQIKK